MEAQILDQRILNLLTSKSFQELKAFYSQTTLLNVIGAERSENRHSAFLRWLLSPDSGHGLGTEPLKLLLRLYAIQECKKFNGSQTFGDELYRKILSGNYNIELLEKVEVEKNIGKIDTKKSSKERIDVWTVVSLSYETDEQGINLCFPIAIENKIYSGEGKNQTLHYYRAMDEYCKEMEMERKVKYHPIGILLSPQDLVDISSEQFVNITYQQILDYVLSPISVMPMPQAELSFVQTYIRNLGRPSDCANHDYSPLAISMEERALIENLFNEDKSLFDEIIVAEYADNAKQVLGKDRYSELCKDKEEHNNTKILLQELWKANDDVFKAVVYQQYSERKNILRKLFKDNNRDTSKYKVYYGKDKTEVFEGKRLSKAMTACAIFKAYLAYRPETTLEQLCEAFPCKSINAYYWENYYAELFLPYREDHIDEHGDICLEFTADKRKGTPSLAKWDFYLKEYQLLPIENGKQQAMCVKMWRKGDFDQLIEHIKKQKFTDFITVEECL